MDQQEPQVSDPISARISAEIVAARRSQGTTRDEVAAAARTAGAPPSFTAAALRNVEAGRRPPNVDELVWLAAALNTPVRQLLAEHAGRFGADVAVVPECGRVENATRQAVQDLEELDGRELPLAEAAYALARKLDGDAGMATAAVSKELRATLAEIWEGRVEEDDDEDLGPA